MTEIRHFCDICSEQIHADRTLLFVKTGPERLRRPTIDLCLECLPKLLALLDDRPAGCTAPSPRPGLTKRLGASGRAGNLGSIKRAPNP
jgi:hypothetical protein